MFLIINCEHADEIQTLCLNLGLNYTVCSNKQLGEFFFFNKLHLT